MLPLISLMTLGIIVTVYIVIGLTRSDLAEIRTKRLIKKHPNARKLRARPVVHVVINGHATEECLQSIRKNRYKKLVMTTEDSLPANSFVLSVDGSTRLEPNSILDAVQQITSDPRRKVVSIAPLITFTHSTLYLFRTYALLVRLPFNAASSGFNVGSRGSLTRGKNQHQVFNTVKQLFKLANLMVFIYASYAAANLNQPELILIYISAFSFWLIWSIMRYPYLSLLHKVWFLLLAPVSYVYFIYLTISAPFASSDLQPTRQNAIIKT